MKIEDLKGQCVKKFADKNETNKNLKYLDAQLKQIYEVYLKKSEKSESWLLAKKPVGGFACASCENYIGDLHDSNTYVPWNKYPMRDPNDKLYRIGNGFSRMLQTLNLESFQNNRNVQTLNNENFQTNDTSDLELNNTGMGKSPNKLIKAKNNKGNNNIQNITNPENIPEEQSWDNNNVNNSLENQPKIVKIYKKSRQNI